MLPRIAGLAVPHGITQPVLWVSLHELLYRPHVSTYYIASGVSQAKEVQSWLSRRKLRLAHSQGVSP